MQRKISQPLFGKTLSNYSIFTCFCLTLSHFTMCIPLASYGFNRHISAAIRRKAASRFSVEAVASKSSLFPDVGQKMIPASEPPLTP